MQRMSGQRVYSICQRTLILLLLYSFQFGSCRPLFQRVFLESQFLSLFLLLFLLFSSWTWLCVPCSFIVSVSTGKRRMKTTSTHTITLIRHTHGQHLLCLKKTGDRRLGRDVFERNVKQGSLRTKERERVLFHVSLPSTLPEGFCHRIILQLSFCCCIKSVIF